MLEKYSDNNLKDYIFHIHIAFVVTSSVKISPISFSFMIPNESWPFVLAVESLPIWGLAGLLPSFFNFFLSSSHDLDWCLVMKILSKETSTNKAKLFSLFYIQLFCLILMSSSFFSAVMTEKWWQKFSSCLFFLEKNFLIFLPLFIGLYYIRNQNEQLFFFSFCVFFFSLAISHHQASKRREKTFSFLSSVFPGRMNKKKRQAMVIRESLLEAKSKIKIREY